MAATVGTSGKASGGGLARGGLARGGPDARGEATARGDGLARCDWAWNGPLDMAYHDREWGVPCRDERRLFEMLVLEGMQAGLSWSLILRKREAFRAAFDGFDAEAVARYGEEKVSALLQDAGIVRNRMKILAAVGNARACLDLRASRGSLAAFLWGYVDGEPIVNAWRSMAEMPATTPLSDAISCDLKKLGFRFVGSTIVYSLMQSIGMVNDHLVSCAFR
jgi:DNA-3-methyladenine glycosylase I